MARGTVFGARLAFEAGALIDRARVEPTYQPTAVQANDWAVSLILPGTSSALSRQSQCVGQEGIRVAKGAADINNGDDIGCFLGLWIIFSVVLGSTVVVVGLCPRDNLV